MSHSEVSNLPIRYRHWYLSRLAKHLQQKNELYDKTKPRSDNNSSDHEKFKEFESQINNKLN